MTALPANLAPWRDELAVFPSWVISSIGPWLPRLAATIGPMRAAVADDGEPDGFSGLARRGNYERLLLTEWLLADEHPDEFLRRASSGEHSFVAVARKEPAGTRRATAVFDCGPEQLGGPRVVQLALLIVLAQRARAADAEFTWATATSEHAFRGLNQDAILTLMRARSHAWPTAQRFAVLRESIDSGDDVWVVGGAHTCALAGDAGIDNLACIAEQLALDSDIVQVDVARRRQRARIELAMPPRAIGVQLLRDPFKQTRARPTQAPTRSIIGTTLQFTPDGRRLLARTTGRRVVAWHVPGSPREPQGRMRKLVAEPDELIVGVLSARRRRPLVLIQRGSALVLRGASTPSGYIRLESPPGDGLFPQALPEEPLWRLVPVNDSDGHAFGILARGRLYLVRAQHGESQANIKAVVQDVAAAQPMRSTAGLFVWTKDGGVQLQTLTADGALATVARYDADRPFRVVTAASHQHDQTGLVAIHTGHGQWRIPGTRLPSAWAPSGEVIGVVRTEGSDAPSLIEILPDQKTIALYTGADENELFTGDSPICQATVASNGAFVAALEESGTLWVLSIEHGQPVAIMTPEEL